MMNTIINILKYIWQLPQNIVALVYLWYLTSTSIVYREQDYKGIEVYRRSACRSASLGKYIFLSPYAPERTLRHEYGHTRQSLMLGPLYLIVIGIPSAVWGYIRKIVAPDMDYYQFYTEKWADKLGEVTDRYA